MSTIENGQISLYCHFNKIIKWPGTSFRSPTLRQKYVRNVCHTAPSFILVVLRIKKNKLKCNFHYVAIPMMTSQILEYVDFTETQKSRYFENETLFFLYFLK